MPACRVELVREVVAGPSRAGPEAIASLNHEPADHTVEGHTVIVGRLLLFTRRGVAPFLGALGEPHEIRDGIRGFFVEQADGECSLRRVEASVSTGFHACNLLPGPQSRATRYDPHG